MKKRIAKKRFHTVRKANRPVSVKRNRVKLIKVLLNKGIDRRVLNTFTHFKAVFNGSGLANTLNNPRAIHLVLSGADITHIAHDMNCGGKFIRMRHAMSDGTGSPVRKRGKLHRDANGRRLRDGVVFLPSHLR